MKKVFFQILTLVLLLSRLLPASANASDIILQAFQDEMARSMKRLKLNDHTGPYFISYKADEHDTIRFAASCGALTENSHNRWRTIKVDVRQGDYHLDSSNFNVRPTAALVASPSFAGGAMTVDDNYYDIRRTLWSRTDAAYKAAIKNFEAKKNFLEQNNVSDRPDDFSQEAQVVLINKSIKLDINSDRWLNTTKSVSAIFRDYPAIQLSIVRFTADKCTHWFANSEGSHNRQSENQYSFIIMASFQADDGMQLADSLVFCANNESDLPKQEELVRAVKEMNENLMHLKSAHLASEYRGPILFEGQSSAEFINQILRYDLGHAQEVLTNSDNSGSVRRNPLKGLVGQPIFPSFISIVDDPLTEKFHGQPIIGGHKIDDDGIPGQKIVLVDKGILKTFCTSRIPTLYTKHSNGHSGAGNGEASILYVDSDNQLNAKQLKEKLIDLGKKAGLRSVMIVRRLGTFDDALFNPVSLLAEATAHASSGISGGLFVRSPLLLYSVSVDDGHEELLRGAQFGPLSLRILREIICTGNDAKPWFVSTVEPEGLACCHIVTPSLLIGEVELHEPRKETDKLPILPSPLSEK